MVADIHTLNSKVNYLEMIYFVYRYQVKFNSTRITAQRGVFTVFPHQKNVIPLEQFPDSSTFLYKICIASERFTEIQEQLKRYGITKIALFPELQSIADEIRNQVLAERI